MKTTCGIFIKYIDSLLIVHATKSSLLKWSIPKGILEEDEDSLDRAIIEVREETGLDLEEVRIGIKYLTKIPYAKSNKMLVAFYIDLNSAWVKSIGFSLNLDFKCESLTEGGFPEVDIIRFEKIERILKDDLLHEAQMRVLLAYKNLFI